MQLKALINNRAKAAGVSPQLMLQNYMLERLIDRISRSSWRDCIIVKGGMLIGSLIGVDRRTTKDLDTTVRGFTLTHSKAAEVFGEICAIDAEDDLSFELLRTDDIREADEYPGHPGVSARLLRPVGRPAHSRCDNRGQDHAQRHRVRVPVRVRRGLCDGHGLPAGNRDGREDPRPSWRGTSRPRASATSTISTELWRVRGHAVRTRTLAQALVATCEKRNSWEAVERREEIIDDMREDAGLRRQWQAYASRNTLTPQACLSGKRSMPFGKSWNP